MEFRSLEFNLCLLVFLPGFAFVLLGLSWLLGWPLRERVVARLTAYTYSFLTIAVGCLWARMVLASQYKVVASLGNWFEVEDYGFQLTLFADRLSMPLISLSVVLVGVVGLFSIRYLHRDKGFIRFFLLLHLFGFAIVLLFGAGSFDLLIAGWELVGITSVLLIAFFQHRNEPVRNALRVFATYRACDIGLLVGMVMLHHIAGSAAFTKLFLSNWPATDSALAGGSATLVGFLLLLAAMGKAAQVPFSGWLPRAMEGPTPSSAIFYGALSVHAGAYLLLRAMPIFAASPLATNAIIVIGILTAVHATMVGRTCADAKTSLAYASMAQLGIIFVEIGLGWSWIALFHITGHAVVRTLQFLRAPSMLHDFHRIHSASGGHLGRTGVYYELFFPTKVRNWLYRLAIDRGHHDLLLNHFIVTPIDKFAHFLYSLETKWSRFAVGSVRVGEQRLAAKTGLLSIRKKKEGINVH